MKKGWARKRIGDVCDLATGGTPSRSRQEYFGGDIKWLVSGDIHRGEIYDCEGRITKAGMKNSNAKLLPPNSVMIALNGQGKTRATVALLRASATCNQSLVCITPKPSAGLLPEFLYANLHGRYEELRRLTSDDDKDRRGLNMGIVRSIEIPIAPLSEQRRIVGILDEAFEGLATATANAEKNLHNAYALFESHLQSVFTQRGKGWVEKRIGDVFDVGSSKRVLEKDWTPSGVPFYGGREVVQLAQSGAVVSDAYISEERYRDIAAVYGVPQEGDILMTARGTIGVGYVVKKSDKFYYKDGNLICLHPKTPTEPYFVLYAFRSKLIKDQLATLTGATVTHLPIEKTNSLLLPFPVFSIQKRVVGDLRKLESEAQRLESIYQQKLAALGELKKSLLHRAFNGELTGDNGQLTKDNPRNGELIRDNGQ